MIILLQTRERTLGKNRNKIIKCIDTNRVLFFVQDLHSGLDTVFL